MLSSSPTWPPVILIASAASTLHLSFSSQIYPRLRGTSLSAKRSGAPLSCRRSSGMRRRTRGSRPPPWLLLRHQQGRHACGEPRLRRTTPSPLQEKKAQAAAATEKAVPRRRHRRRSARRLRSRRRVWPQTSPCPPWTATPLPWWQTSPSPRRGGSDRATCHAGNCQGASAAGKATGVT